MSDAASTQPGALCILGNHRLHCGNWSSFADVDRLLAGASIFPINIDPPYNVKVKPRSNTAIAAGLSSFAGTSTRRSRRRRSSAQKAVRWPTTSSPMASSTNCWRPGSGTWPAQSYESGASPSGAATPTSPTTRMC